MNNILKILSLLIVMCLSITLYGCSSETASLNYVATAEILTDALNDPEGTLIYTTENENSQTYESYKDEQLAQKPRTFEFAGEICELTYQDSLNSSVMPNSDNYFCNYKGATLFISFFRQTDTVSKYHIYSSDQNTEVFLADASSATSQKDRKELAEQTIKNYRDYDFSDWKYTETSSTLYPEGFTITFRKELYGIQTNLYASVDINKNGKVVCFSASQTGWKTDSFTNFDPENCREAAEQKIVELLTVDGTLTSDYDIYGEMFDVSADGSVKYKVSYMRLDNNGELMGNPIYITVSIIEE